MLGRYLLDRIREVTEKMFFFIIQHKLKAYYSTKNISHTPNTTPNALLLLLNKQTNFKFCPKSLFVCLCLTSHRQ